ncbi:hypothetical protein FNW02_35640 [Komarekiella sp. 'clone 1']|uniref:Uncharacterized protein n=1 Tax=Komarekiella delphini-convector SJRDD-AB1 TaxID=2593771 RepID=A0AA40T5E9_9NOST|nr:hypothetical protein [Komarekiella delphini-convector]MBD6620920.1 hypothetical protein [Komarekiella delphini-convector SJRDD-AB1]
MNTPLPLEPPESALEALLQLRDYYAPLVEEYERLYTQSKDSLTHVEALLSNWSSVSSLEQESSSPQKEEKSLLFLADESKNDDDLEDIPLEPLKLDDSESEALDADDGISELPESPIFPLIETRSDEEPDAALSPESPQPYTFPLLETRSDEESDVAKDTSGLPQPISPIIGTETSTQQPSLHGVEIPMLPQYQSLSRPEAIEQILAEEIGTSVHIDFIVRSLYGELEPEVFKVVKSRVQSSLTQGKESNKWFSVPGEPGYFTLSLTLLSKKQTKNSSPQAKRKNNKPIKPPQPSYIPMLKVYEGQFLIDALSTFLEQNAGKIFSVAEVITGIYGELNAADVREVKNKVLNELSRGHRTGRFTRVPAQIGFYTWDYKLIKE